MDIYISILNKLLYSLLLLLALLFLALFMISKVLPRALKDRLKERLGFFNMGTVSTSIGKRGKILTFDRIKTLIKKDKLGYRPCHSLCLLYATLQAQKMNLNGITVIELGVAGGRGVLNLCEISSIFAKATDINFRVYGFDAGTGLPKIEDYRDHPEIWSKAKFEMGNQQELLRKIKDYEPDIKADIIFGNVKNTIPDFISNILSPDSPVGFISVDLDLYSSTKPAPWNS